MTEGPACRLSPSQDSHAILGSWLLQWWHLQWAIPPEHLFMVPGYPMCHLCKGKPTMLKLRNDSISYCSLVLVISAYIQDVKTGMGWNVGEPRSKGQCHWQWTHQWWCGLECRGIRTSGWMFTTGSMIRIYKQCIRMLCTSGNAEWKLIELSDHYETSLSSRSRCPSFKEGPPF